MPPRKESKSKTITKEDVARCLKEHGNWSKIKPEHRFDGKQFNPATVREDMVIASPKLAALIEKIRELDAADMKREGQLFKHFIYSDIKSPYGAKLIASGLAASGFKHAFRLRGSSFQLEAPTADAFATMTSVSFFEKPLGVKFRREILKRFNARPSNVHGDELRIIILDSGFREGVDLFDVKYAHLFEPILTAADQKQAVGRATRFCGQMGLNFHAGWPLNVFRYETTIPLDVRAYIINERPELLNKEEETLFDLFIKFSNIDPRKITFANELEKVVVEAAVDRALTQHIHNIRGGARMNHSLLSAHVNKEFSKYEWPKVKVENGCMKPPTSSLEFSPTQDFMRHFLTVDSPYHGTLAYHSVGTGKTCMAIATATTTFEPAGWTILYVTKHTLKGDVWKNMFDHSCSVILQQRMADGLVIPKDDASRMRLLTKSWTAIKPLSYKQFSNMLQGRNAFSGVLKSINGAGDPLKKTLVIIDEAHKLFAPDVVASEKADVDTVRNALHHSYRVSGAAAAKVLLMTGTPYTDAPMDMMRLLNLLRDADQQLPEDFDAFAAKYLNADGRFTDLGKKAYFDDVAGLISYLNREKDIRTFAYPVFKDIRVPMSTYEFARTLDDIMLSQADIKKNQQHIDQLKDDEKRDVRFVKNQYDRQIRDLDQQVKNCKKSDTLTKKQCKDAAMAVKREETRVARAAAKIEASNCPSGRGNKEAANKCKAKIKERLEVELEMIKNEYAQAVKDCASVANVDCTKLKNDLAELKRVQKQKMYEAKQKIAKDIANQNTYLQARKNELKLLKSTLRTRAKEDRSQQTAIDECLSIAGVTSEMKNRIKSNLAPDVGLGSRDSSSSSSSEKEPVYLISGHGVEKYVPFDERPVMPADTYLVVFSTCFKPNYVDRLCRFMDVFSNPAHTAMLSEPLKNKEKIESLINAEIRIFAPGDRAPALFSTLFLNFQAHKVSMLKSGVFRVPNIPHIHGPENYRDIDILGDERACTKYSRVIPSPAHYSKTIHNEMYNGNIYRSAAKQKSYVEMDRRRFSVHDIIQKFKSGVYYSVGCRSTFDVVKDADIAEIMERSEEQQLAHYKPAAEE